MFKGLRYYFSASWHRKILDKLLEENKHYFKGSVLDIGGRDRGRFEKPRQAAKQWIFADIEKENNPDIILDVADMKGIAREAVDVVLATELFEHVENPEQGLKECFRVLKKNGAMILSVPFLYQVHSDPYDFQRWTSHKWKKELAECGFRIEKFIVMGRYFTVLADVEKEFIKSLPRFLKWFCYLFFPFYDLMVKFDNLDFIKNHQKLGKFHGGYFMVLRK